MISLIRAADKALVLVERAILVLFLSVMVLLAFSQVLLRNLFNTSFLWADPLLRHLVLWLGFFGGAIAAHQEKHINLDLISRFASPRIVNAIHVVSNLFGATVCALLSRAGWVFLASERENAEELFSAGGISFPTWWFESIIPVGFALIGLHFALKALERMLAKEPAPPLAPALGEISPEMPGDQP